MIAFIGSVGAVLYGVGVVIVLSWIVAGRRADSRTRESLFGRPEILPYSRSQAIRRILAKGR